MISHLHIHTLLFGDELATLHLLLSFMGQDLVTQGLVQLNNRHFSLTRLKALFLQKLTIFIVISVAHGMDSLFGNQHLLRELTIYFYIANEALLILEHATQLHLLVPTKLKQVIQQLLQKQEES